MIPYKWFVLIHIQVQSVVLTAMIDGNTSFSWEKANPLDMQRKLIYSEFVKGHTPEGGGGKTNRNKVAREDDNSQEQSGPVCALDFFCDSM